MCVDVVLKLLSHMSSSPVFLLTLNRNIWDGSLAVEKTISKGNQTVSIVSNITVTFTHSRIVWIVKTILDVKIIFSS